MKHPLYVVHDSNLNSILQYYPLQNLQQGHNSVSNTFMSKDISYLPLIQFDLRFLCSSTQYTLSLI